MSGVGKADSSYLRPRNQCYANTGAFSSMPVIIDENHKREKIISGYELDGNEETQEEIVISVGARTFRAHAAVGAAASTLEVRSVTADREDPALFVYTLGANQEFLMIPRTDDQGQRITEPVSDVVTLSDEDDNGLKDIVVRISEVPDYGSSLVFHCSESTMILYNHGDGQFSLEPPLAEPVAPTPDVED